MKIMKDNKQCNICAKQEIWKDIKEHEGYYMVSNLGRVKTLDRWRNCPSNKKIKYLRKGKILKQMKDKSGYLLVSLYKNKKARRWLVHRLVAETFIPNPENKPQVNHKDGNKQNKIIYKMAEELADWYMDNRVDDRKIDKQYVINKFTNKVEEDK